jgi:tripartite-type tricarboxylate transporter receptor subunit TctC
MFERALIARSVYDPSRVKVNFRDFTWLGSMNSDLGICVLWNRHGLKTVADIKKYSGEVALAGTSKNGGGYVYAALLKSMSPKNVKQVFGYKGTSAMLLAAERGEADGTCGHLSSIQTRYPDLLAEKKINVVVQYAEKRNPALPDVQTAYEIARSDSDRKIISFLTAATVIGRPVIAPPGIPADRAATLQKAFIDTMKDPEFLAFAEKSKMELDPIDSEGAAKIVESILATPPAAVEATRKILE